MRSMAKQPAEEGYYCCVDGGRLSSPPCTYGLLILQQGIRGGSSCGNELELGLGNQLTTEMSDFLFSAMYLLMGTMWSEVLKINCNKTDFSMGIAPNSLSEKFNIFGDMTKYFFGKSLKKKGCLMVCTC